MHRAYYSGTTSKAFVAAAATTSSQQTKIQIPSIGFSGAGFLTTYHLGVSKCLIEHGYLNFEPKYTNYHHRVRVTATPDANDDDDDDGLVPPPLTGVSGGAITIASVGAGVDPEIGMITALNASQKTRQAGFLDAFQPGFSLLDQVELPMLKDIKDAVGNDTELLLRRIRGGKIIRIGLTDRSITPFVSNPKAYVYLDQYRDAEDIVAACMISSFVPGVTGPYSRLSPTIRRATARLQEMLDLGFVKKKQRRTKSKHRSSDDRGGRDISSTETFSPLLGSADRSPNDDENETKDNKSVPRFVDGGLSNGYPVYDENTLLVTPLRGKFDPNRFICPRPSSSSDNDNDDNKHKGDNDDEDDDTNLMKISNRVKLYMNRQNALTLRRMILSSEDSDLQWRYGQGYDDAKQFLVANNLETVHRRGYDK